MVRNGTKWLLVTVLALTVGFHWAILQSAAWAGMLVRYSQETSISEAFQKTFDGQNPCRLCHFVQEGQKAEKESETTLDIKKLDPFPDHTPFVFFFDFPSIAISKSPPSLLSHLDSPLSPPPRSA